MNLKYDKYEEKHTSANHQNVTKKKKQKKRKEITFKTSREKLQVFIFKEKNDPYNNSIEINEARKQCNYIF